MNTRFVSASEMRVGGQPDERVRRRPELAAGEDHCGSPVRARWSSCQKFIEFVRAREARVGHRRFGFGVVRPATGSNFVDAEEGDGEVERADW